MKRRELLKLFTNAGWYFLRNGANHDIYTNGKDNVPIPRHPDINEVLARALIKKWGLKQSLLFNSLFKGGYIYGRYSLSCIIRKN